MKRQCFGLSLVAALLWTASCSDAPVEKEPRAGFEPVQRIEFRAAPAEPDEVVQRLSVPRAIAPWTVSRGGTVVDVDVDGETRAALQFEKSGSTVVSIPGPFDGSEFNLVAVDIATPYNFDLSAALVRDGGAPVVSQGAEWRRSTFFSRVFIDLRNASGTRPYDRLELRKAGIATDWSLLSVELLSRPPDGWLPSAAAASWIRFGFEGRVGVAVSNERPVAAEVDVPDGGVLEFSYAFPPGPGASADDCALVVTVSSGGSSETTRHAFDGPVESKAPWLEASVPLARFAGQRVELSFALETPTGPRRACALADAFVHAPDPESPAVFLITSDTHRGDHVGAAQGDVPIQTPNLDRLAASGVYFANCVASTNVTVPSHTALLTGMHPRDHGVLHNNMSLSDKAVTLAERFRDAGYRTFAATSVAHLSPEMSGLGQGFDRMLWPWPEKEQTTADFAVGAVTSWLEAADGEPVFVWLHVFDAHRPYTPPDDYRDLYYSKDVDPTDRKKFRRKRKFPVPPDPGLGLIRDINWIYALYRGEVSYLDEQLAPVVDHPRALSGILVLTSDHGESLAAHDIYWSHNGLYPDTLHVPLFLRYPGCAPGTRVERSVRQIDVGATLLALAGLQPDGFPTRDLLHEVAGSDQRTERFVSEPRYGLESSAKSASIELGRWFLNIVLKPGNKNGNRDWGVFEKHAVELYDLEADPKCETNLVDSELERARELRGLLVTWLLGVPQTTWGEEGETSAERTELLAQLGYASNEAVSSELFDPECDCERCEPFR